VTDIYAGIHEHLKRFWPKNQRETFSWGPGPIRETLPHWQVVRITPLRSGEPWVYATVGAWEIPTEANCGMEFVLLSPREDPIHVETQAMVSNFHADPRYRVHLGKVLDIGRPWMDDSNCNQFLVSLPYPQGPGLENCYVDGYHVRFLWLLPITATERRYLEANGQEALERRFEGSGINAVDPLRQSVA
jgi:hypothetical protein